MRPTHIEVNLNAIGHNLSQVRSLVGPDVKIMGVVKANAYGHGMVEVARYLETQNIDMLGVAFVQEAIVLRRAGITQPILVFYGALENEFHHYAEHDLHMTVSSYDNALALNQFLDQSGATLNVHLKTDTGMGRIGVQHDAAPALAEQITRLPRLRLAGVYSHLATSEGGDDLYVELQLERFYAVIEDLKERGIETEYIHLANSGGIMNYPDSHFTIVRPGIMLYGYPPGERIPGSITLKQPLSLKSITGFIKEVGTNVSISYGRKFTTTKPTRIGTIPLGYGDGYNRLLSNKSSVLIRGKRYPVVGTVCMDQIMVDLGMDNTISVGDEVTLIGRHGSDAITASELARYTGTISYEVLCALSARIPRIYTGTETVPE